MQDGFLAPSAFLLALRFVLRYDKEKGGIAVQLCIKQRVFSWSDTYDIYDESGAARYYVRAEFFSFGHQIHVYEKASGREVGSIHQKLFTLMPCFEIVMDGRVVGTVKKEFSFFVPRYRVDFRGWQAEGDFLGWDYRVTQGPVEVMTISKAWLSWGDTYTLSYQNPAHEMPGLLLVLAIDAANCDND